MDTEVTSSRAAGQPVEWWRGVMGLLNVVLVIMLSTWCGVVGNRAFAGQGLDTRSENLVVLGSLASFVACVVIGAVSISVSGAREASWSKR